MIGGNGIATNRVVKLTPVQKKALKELQDAIDKECEVQTSLVYRAGAIALNRLWGWKGRRVLALYKMQEDIYDECINTGYSMVEMLYNETGIELRRDDAPDVSFKDCKYLCSDFGYVVLNYQETLYMKMQKRKWVRTNILACFGISLHRKYGVGFERLSRLLDEIRDVLWEFNGDVLLLSEACAKEADFVLTDDPLTASYDRFIRK